MKQIYFAIISIFISVIASAQITITQSDMPSAPIFGQGDTVRYSTASATTSNIDVTQTGANFIWDFSSLVPSGQGVNEYKNSTTTLYSLLGAGFNAIGLKQQDVNLQVVQLTNAYEFYNKTSSVWEAKAIGYTVSGVPIPSSYSNTDKIYNFPLTYNDHDTDDFHYTLSISNIPGIPLSINYVRAGTRVNEVDGYGSITTPFGTYQCIRVKSTITETDSVDLGFGFPVAIPNNRVEYKWLANGIKIPVLEVVGNSLLGSFTATSIKYPDIYRNLRPVADFVADETNPFRWVPVNFTNNTTSASTANIQYKWSITPTGFETYENGTSQTSTNPAISFTLDTVFTVQLKATNNSGSDSIIKTSYIKVKKEIQSVNEIESSRLQLFPNPATDKLVMSLDASEKMNAIRIYNLQGKLVQAQNASNASVALIDIQTLSNGEYIIEAVSNTNVYHKKFVKFH
jgi:PKD repeat protein